MGNDVLQHWLRQWHRNKNLRLGTLAFILVVGAVFVWVGLYVALRSQSATPLLEVKSVLAVLVRGRNQFLAKHISQFARRLDGMMVESTAATNHYPIAVMIENAAFDGVRPQFGLNHAQVVYEVVVEGGITRLLAIFTGNFPDKLGPVRSARPTYLEFVSEYDAYYAHAGGSPQVLQSIAGLPIKDLSALGIEARYFYRDQARVAPHNLFTSNQLLELFYRDKHLAEQTPTYEVWQFKNDNKPTTEPTSQKTVAISFGSSSQYDVHYVYNYVDNNYERWNGGDLQHDANDQSILTTKNIIIQMVPEAINAGDNGRINFAVTGEGKVYVVRDGEVIEGIWKKLNRQSRTKFYNNAGEEIALNRGRSWIEIVPENGQVTYH